MRLFGAGRAGHEEVIDRQPIASSTSYLANFASIDGVDARLAQGLCQNQPGKALVMVRSMSRHDHPERRADLIRVVIALNAAGMGLNNGLA